MRRAPAVCLALLAAVLGGAGSAVLGVCGPFTDVSDAGFCPFVLEIFTLGITTGTTPTTYDPGSSVTRLQMAAFLSRTVDGVLRRGSQRALIKKFWSPQNSQSLGLTSLGANAGPFGVGCDGKDVWVAHGFNGDVSRVRGSDGKLLGTWIGTTQNESVLVAMGRVFVTGFASPGKLYRIDPSQAAGALTTVTSNLGGGPFGIAFDGSRIWTGNSTSISIVTPGAAIPWTVTTVTSGFSEPRQTLFDGSNIWVADLAAQTLLKLDGSGAVLQTVTVAGPPVVPAFDGTNIWVPTLSNSVSVVRAATGAVLATLTGNGLDLPDTAAFDGQRVLVTNSANSVSLWRAADLAALGSIATGSNTGPAGVCSDGFNFWIALNNSDQLARF